MNKTTNKNPHAVALGRKGGAAGTGDAKRRDQRDPNFYARLSAVGIAAREKKRKLKSDS